MTHSSAGRSRYAQPPASIQTPAVDALAKELVARYGEDAALDGQRNRTIHGTMHPANMMPARAPLGGGAPGAAMMNQPTPPFGLAGSGQQQQATQQQQLPGYGLYEHFAFVASELNHLKVCALIIKQTGRKPTELELKKIVDMFTSMRASLAVNYAQHIPERLRRSEKEFYTVIWPIMDVKVREWFRKNMSPQHPYGGQAGVPVAATPMQQAGQSPTMRHDFNGQRGPTAGLATFQVPQRSDIQMMDRKRPPPPPPSSEMHGLAKHRRTSNRATAAAAAAVPPPPPQPSAEALLKNLAEAAANIEEEERTKSFEFDSNSMDEDATGGKGNGKGNGNGNGAHDGHGFPATETPPQPRASTTNNQMHTRMHQLSVQRAFRLSRARAVRPAHCPG